MRFSVWLLGYSEFSVLSVAGVQRPGNLDSSLISYAQFKSIAVLNHMIFLGLGDNRHWQLLSVI